MLLNFAAILLLSSTVKAEIIDEEVEVFQPMFQSRPKLGFDFDLKLNPITSNYLCNLQLKYFQESFDKNELWALKMRDAWGNVPSGIYSGNLFDFGNFDQCIDLEYYSSEVGKVVGQHCTVTIPIIREQSVMARITVPSRSENTNMNIGVCLPAACQPDDVKETVDDALMNLWNTTTPKSYDPKYFCSIKARPFEFSPMRIFAIIFFSAFIGLLIISTIYDVWCNSVESKRNPVLGAFSVYTNSKLIMTMKPMISKEMVFLHGIRSIAIIWIVFGHTFALTFWKMPSINANYMLDEFKNAFIMIFFSGYVAVDTFFMLSALLLTLSIFRELDRTSKINLSILYLKRYVRITVPVAAGIIFTLGFLKYLSNGPAWNMLTSIVGEDMCRTNWWSTLLYIGNFATPGKLCFGHSWFLMVDMQLYFLSPLILYPLWKLRHRMAVVISLIFVIASTSIIYIFTMFLLFDFRVSFLSDTAPLKDALYHTMTISRIGSWMMGILVGYIMHNIEGKGIKLSRSAVAIGWTLCSVTMLTIIFAQYPLHQENFKEISPIADATYSSLHGIFWCLAMAWVIIACHLTNNGVVERFLSLSVWLPISKLSFCIYLMHIPVQFIYLSSTRTPAYVSYLRALYKFFGDFSVTFFIAFAWALLFEYPTLNIIAILLAKRRAKLETKEVSSSTVSPS